MLTPHTRARLVFTLPFLAAGIGIGAWASTLPVLADFHELDKGQLGNILLCFALGAILFMVAVGRFNTRFDSTTLSLIGALVFACGLVSAALVRGDWLLALSVFVAGSGFGVLDVSMNTSVSNLERQLEKHVMSSFHALFSVGNLIAAFFVARILIAGGNLTACLGTAAFLIAVMSIAGFLGAASYRVADAKARKEDGGNARLERSPIAQLLLLGCIAFFAFMAEGGIMDWSAVYLVSEIGTPESVGAYGLGIFATAMALGRLLGDFVVSRFGAIRLMLICAFTCALSVGLLILSSSAGSAFAALAISGLAIGNIVPTVFGLTGKIGGRATGKAMSIVTTMGYSGLLLGPAILGYVAQETSLQASLGLIVGAFVLIVFGSLGLKHKY